jgi:hypothetical protein
VLCVMEVSDLGSKDTAGLADLSAGLDGAGLLSKSLTARPRRV